MSSSLLQYYEIDIIILIFHSGKYSLRDFLKSAEGHNLRNTCVEMRTRYVLCFVSQSSQ